MPAARSGGEVVETPVRRPQRASYRSVLKAVGYLQPRKWRAGRSKPRYLASVVGGIMRMSGSITLIAIGTQPFPSSREYQRVSRSPTIWQG